MKKTKQFTTLFLLVSLAMLFTGFSRVNPTFETASKSTADTAKSVKYTVEQAKQIAFEDAGVKEEDVVLKKAGLTTDDGVVVYEVEFYYKDTEYEYDIDPNTGVISDLDQDPMEDEDYTKMEFLQQISTDKTSKKADGITVDEAKQIAFEDAGIKGEKDVVLKKAELSKDDGIDVYEVEFYYMDIEHEYDIDPKTGIITDVDRDPMDAEDYAEMKALQQKAANGNTAGSVDEDKAFEIALAHAKVSAADVYDKEVKLDYDNDLGKEIYDVDFKAGGIEYDYDIDPATGEILDYEAEADD